MSLSLGDFENNARKSIQHFWQTRLGAATKQKELGRIDQGERAGVTAGKNMDGYAERYHQLCKKLMQENLYDAAAFMLTTRESVNDGNYSKIDKMTGLHTFVSQLAGRVAAESIS